MHYYVQRSGSIEPCPPAAPQASQQSLAAIYLETGNKGNEGALGRWLQEYTGSGFRHGGKMRQATPGSQSPSLSPSGLVHCPLLRGSLGEIRISTLGLLCAATNSIVLSPMSTSESAGICPASHADSDLQFRLHSTGALAVLRCSVPRRASHAQERWRADVARKHAAAVTSRLKRGCGEAWGCEEFS